MQDRPEDYERARGKYIIDSRTMQALPKSSVVMHPLPRVDEARSLQRPLEEIAKERLQPCQIALKINI